MADVWREVLLLTIKETEGKKQDGSGFGMWVIQKVKNDTSFNVTVRAGRYYTDKVSGEKKYPRDGMSEWDFEDIKKYWDQIKVLIDRRNPPAVQPLEEPAEETQAEEMPWS